MIINLKGKIFFGMLWTLAERTLAQGISFLVSIILARLLLPEEYGIIAIVLVFINIADVFVNNGFGEVLIQNKYADEKDYSTIFYCAFLISLILMGTLNFLSPYISNYFSMPLLAEILPWLLLKLPISAFNTVQHAYVSKHMIFKKFFYATSGATFLSGMIGIVMALNDYGIWALVAQVILLSAFDTIILLFIIPWHPVLYFSFSRAFRMADFAGRIIFANLINVLYIEMSNLVIGKFYKPSDLGYYNRGMQFPSLIVNNINTAIGKVIFPAMSELQDNRIKLKGFAKKSMILSSYIIFPLLTMLAMISKPLVSIILTNKWLICVPYIQIACIFYGNQPLQTINWQIIKSLGRADICLKLELLKKCIGVFILFLTINMGVKAIACGFAISGIISMLINMLPNNKLIMYSVKEQITDIMPTFFCCIIMAVVMNVWNMVDITPGFLILIQITTGFTVYILFSKILKLEGISYIINIIRERTNEKSSF